MFLSANMPLDLRDNDKQKNSTNVFKGGCHAMQQKQEKIAPLGAGICGPLRRAGSGGGGQRLGRANRDGAALLYGQRRVYSRGRPDCRQQRGSLWLDILWRVRMRRGVQAL